MHLHNFFNITQSQSKAFHVMAVSMLFTVELIKYHLQPGITESQSRLSLYRYNYFFDVLKVEIFSFPVFYQHIYKHYPSKLLMVLKRCTSSPVYIMFCCFGFGSQMRPSFFFNCPEKSRQYFFLSLC